MESWIALLRAVNVGGKNKLPMAELRRLLAELGLRDVTTLLQSGNAVFRESEDRGNSSREELSERLEAGLEARFGFRPEFILRSLQEWRELIDENPFPEAAESDPCHLLVLVAKSPIAEESADQIRSTWPGPERFAVRKGVLYTHFVDGIGTSKLATSPTYKRLTQRGTARNWNTVLKLAELAAR